MGLEKTVVNSLWVGSGLTFLEELTIRSFIHHGHRFKLWVYDDSIKLDVQGLTIENANDIIPRGDVFRYPEDGKIDWGKGSYAGFSDIFRYKLLYERGGWWVDMDVTCLKHFDFSEPYFFRNHWKYPVVGNVMKAPKGSELMLSCYEKTKIEINEKNLNWHRPIEILNAEIDSFGLIDYRRLGLFNLDVYHHLSCYFDLPLSIPSDWYGIHWINSSGKLSFKPNSTFAQLLKKHSIDITDAERKQGYQWLVDRLKAFTT